jgi:hypothetical protein
MMSCQFSATAMIRRRGSDQRASGASCGYREVFEGVSKPAYQDSNEQVFKSLPALDRLALQHNA